MSESTTSDNNKIENNEQNNKEVTNNKINLKNDEIKKQNKKYSGKILEQLNGVFCVNKPVGLSSSDVVTILKSKITHQLISSNLVDRKKKKRNMIKIGHGGTLDPLASGCLGKKYIN